MLQLLSIGYEKASQGDVLAVLKAAGVELIADVRERPQSRRAGFSKRSLAASAASIGIDYAHYRALGTPPEGREAHRRHDYESFWRIVETQLATPEAAVAFEQLAEAAAQKRAALLCFEADWHVCHRRRVAEALGARGFETTHLTVEPTFS